MPRRKRLDALIVGAGVAGISAALWLRDFGIESLLLEEGSQPGGQLHQIHAPAMNYLLAYGWEGDRIAAGVLSDARSAELRMLVGSPVERVVARMRRVERDGERFEGRTLVVATGLRRRRLGVPGERELLGHGVSQSANLDRTSYAGLPVVVVGGGTAGVEDALLCSELGSPVTLLHRGTSFRARSDFLARARKDPGIHIVPNARLVRILGRDRVEGVVYRTRGAARPKTIEANAVFIRIGWEPRTELVRGQLRLDRDGFVRVGANGATNLPRVYAVGDVCSPDCPSIANAAGQGAAVAWEIARVLGRMR